MRAPGEAHVGLHQFGVGQAVDAIFGIGIVGAQREAPVFVELVQQAVGGHPLLALLGAAVTAVLQLAVPLRHRIGAPAAHAVGTAINAAHGGLQLPVHDREAQVPALCGIEIHTEGMHDAGAVLATVLQILALVVDVDLVAQPPALAQRPAALQAGIEQRIGAGAVGAVAVTAVQAVVGRHAVLAIHLGTMATAATADFRTDTAAVAEQIPRAEGQQVVLLVRAAIVIQGHLAGAVQLP